MAQRLSYPGSVFMLILLLCWGCGQKGAVVPREEDPPVSEGGCFPAHWGYDYNLSNGTAPQDWRWDCQEGKHQSPIDVNTHSVKIRYNQNWVNNQEELLFNYPNSVDLKVGYCSYTVKIKVLTGHPTIRLGDKVYELVQFHFHARSEHLISGVDYPLEIHLVHTDPDHHKSPKVVLGIFAQIGERHLELQKIWKHLPHFQSNSPRDTKWLHISAFNLNTLLPRAVTTYRYDGSLTTPPCSERIRWILFSEPVNMALENLSAAGELFQRYTHVEGNRRPLQMIHQRIVDTDLNQAKFKVFF